VLAGRYRLEELLGRGGMGCVWRAQHLALGTPVAIKLVHPSIAAQRGMLRRFLREAQAAARLRGINVVQILDHGVDGGQPYIAMECLEGESLAARLRREGTLSTAATALVMTGCCRALSKAHRLGIVHRDLKPDNIFLARDEGATIVKVLDFGIAKIVEQGACDPDASTVTGNRTTTGLVLGTPRYMSPEQARGRSTIDGRSDLWSLAVIACECLTGKPPFPAGVMGELVLQICSDPLPIPSSLAPVPPGFDAWFGRALRRNPAARFQTVREFADALAEVLTPGQRWIEDHDGAAGTLVNQPRDEPALETVRKVYTVGESSGAAPRVGPRRALVAGSVVAFAAAVAGITRWRTISATVPQPATASVASATTNIGLATTEPQPAPVGPPIPADTEAMAATPDASFAATADTSVEKPGKALRPGKTGVPATPPARAPIKHKDTLGF
jgi:serine/threonine-protein kinase